MSLSEEIENVKAVLQGETINGVKLGDHGISEQWCKRTIASLEAIRHGSPTGDVCGHCGNPATLGARTCEWCKENALEDAYGQTQR